MPKHTSHLFYTAVAVLLFAWTVLEWVRMVAAIFARVTGAPVEVDVCRHRRDMFATLAREFESTRERVPTSSSYAYLRAFERDSLGDLDKFAHLRLIASKFQRARCHSSSWRTTRNNIYERAFIEWGITSRYPTDGPLLFVLSVLGTFHQNAVSFDDARADGSSYANIAASRIFHLKSTSIHSSWSSVRAERQLFPPSTDRIVTQFFQHNTPPLLRADVLSIFIESGREADVLRDVHARILVVHYRDFLGVDENLSLVAPNNSGIVNLPPHPSGLDPTRPAPKYGHNLPALTQLAATNGYRLIWCIRRYPVAIYLHRSTSVHLAAESFFPTLSVRQCYSHRTKATGFKQDMEALWDLADGQRWRTSHI